MSREPKAGEWLRQQIDELGALRNASVRDPQFKAWRQNTLTFIQRIWSDETSKSERFRRIPFTPPSTKHDRNIAREHYERGCGEALEYLNALLASLGEAAAAGAAPALVGRHPESFEGDFPEVDLGGPPAVGDAPAGVAPRAALDRLGEGEAQLDLPNDSTARGQGPPELPASAGRPADLGSSGDFLASAAFLDPEAASPGHLHPPPPAVRTEAPIPPASRISVRNTPRDGEPRVNPLKDFLTPRKEEVAPKMEDPAPRMEEPPAKSHKNGKKGKAPKTRLKDMLGFSNLEAETPADPAPVAESPAPPVHETSRIEIRKPPERHPMAELPHAEAPPEPIAEEPVAAEPAVAESGVVLPAAPIVPRDFPEHHDHDADADLPPLPADETPAFRDGIETSGGWSLPEFMTPAEQVLPLTAADVEPHHDEEPAPAAESAPAEDAEAPSETEPAPAAEEVAAEEDGGHAARVTAEFLKKSPVLSSLPKAVKRAMPATTSAAEAPLSTRGSAASQLLQIASEVDRLGVPEGHRARARAALMDFARQLDDEDLSWEVLREAIHFVMEFPPLARRAMPLLLPFLDVAA